MLCPVTSVLLFVTTRGIHIMTTRMHCLLDGALLPSDNTVPLIKILGALRKSFMSDVNVKNFILKDYETFEEGD